jgi:WD40 repeat protein
MICCLNPYCEQPNNDDSFDLCQSCGSPLEALLRGRYRPVKNIGRGGFGRTYLAVDTDRLDTSCVIKQFAPQTQGTKSFLKAVQLFEQEAQRLNELGEHPQIPTLQAYFEHDKFLYLVQQMVSGHTLYKELLETGPFSETAIRALLSDLLPVLQFIHDRGVIHRDITPNNVIRRKVDGRFVLIDFGIAKQFSDALLQETGTRIGTEGYSPIEQFRSGQAYPASDIYSLGATCLHLLTGCKPESLYDAMEGRWIWQEKLRDMDRSLHPGLTAIINLMVQDLVGDRYPSAQAVLDDLRRLPQFHGEVPGWGSDQSSPGKSGSSLFSSIGSMPVSGAGAPSTSSPPASNPKTPPIPPPSVSAPPSSVPLTQPPPPPRPSMPASGPSASGGRFASPSRPASASPAGARQADNAADRVSGEIGRVRSRARTENQQPGWQTVGELKGHQSWVVTVAFHPKQPMVVSGSLDDTIRVWNWETETLLHTLSGHPRGVNHVVLTPDGQGLASCGDDATARLWNLSDGRLTHTFKGHLRDVNAVAVGESSPLLASGSEDSTIKLWAIDRGTLLRTLTGAGAMIKTVALTARDQLLVSGGLNNAVQVWNLQTGKLIKVLSGHTNTVNQVIISPDGRFIASASKDRTIRIWSLATGNLVQTLKGHTQEVNTVAFFPGSQFLASGSSDGSLKLWRVKTGAVEQNLSGHFSSVLGVVVHPSGKLIASASADKTIKLWKWVR